MTGVVVSAAAAVVAGIFAAALFRRWTSRGRVNPALLSWGISLAMFSVAALSLAVGAAIGWSGLWFRLYYLLGGVLVVPWLALGTIQTTARDRVTRRVLGYTSLVVCLLFIPPMLAAGDPLLFGTGVVLAALLGVLLTSASEEGAVAGAVLLTVAFTVIATFAVLATGFTASLPTDTVPEGSELFPRAVRSFAVAGNALGAILVIVGAATSALRLRGRGTPHLVVGNLLIALGVLIAASGGLFAFLGDVASHAVAFAVGVSVMYAGFTRTTRTVEPAIEVRDEESAWR